MRAVLADTEALQMMPPWQGIGQLRQGHPEEGPVLPLDQHPPSQWGRGCLRGKGGRACAVLADTAPVQVLPLS